MIKIAICDDNSIICTTLEQILIRLLNKMPVKYDIDIFNTGERICEYLKKETYHIIFLDIELPEKSGIDVGIYLRETLQNDITQIAFISSHKHYANSLFDLRPINFLVKPLIEEKVKKVMDTYFRITKHNEQIFSYRKGTTHYNILLDKIIFFENINRKIKIVTIDSEDEFYDNIEQLYEKLNDYNFLLIHKSYLINFRYIKTMKYDQVTMINDMVLPISQTRRKEFNHTYSEILRRTY